MLCFPPIKEASLTHRKRIDSVPSNRGPTNQSMARIHIITGHYGSGKTEYAVNLALHFAAQKKKTALADLDIVNPYFRSYEQTERLKNAGVEVIVTSLGGVADIPAIHPSVLSIFQDDTVQGVLDVGGDPVGARVLARFAPIIQRTDHALLFVFNANRPETKNAECALTYLKGIEAQSSLRVTGIVNNTHLCGETTMEEIRKGALHAEELSERTGIPVVCHAVARSFANRAASELNAPVFPMELYMKKPWELNESEEDPSLWPEL